MDSTEFKQWQEFHRSNFPDYASYCDRLPAESRRVHFEAFCRILENVSLESAMAATSGLLDGKYNTPESWEYNRGWNQTARVIRDIAAVIETQQQRVVSPNFSGRQETYTCHHCRDTGMCEVYSARSMQRLGESTELREVVGSLRDNPPPKPPTLPMPNDDRPADSLSRMLAERLAGAGVVRREIPTNVRAARSLTTMMVICDCVSGQATFARAGMREDDKGSKSRTWTENMIFAESRYFRCPDGETVKHAVGFVDWLEDRIENAARESKEAKPGYTAAFDEFNQPAF